MTTFRIQELEGMGFEWGVRRRAPAAWEGRLSELAIYRKMYGHCNVPYNYSATSKLANWFGTQRINYLSLLPI